MAWKKGQSGNPGGRSKAVATIAREIRKQTNGCKDLVDWAMKVWKGEEDGMKSEYTRLAAFRWLGERSMGQPVQDIDVLIEDGGSRDDLPLQIDAILGILDERGREAFRVVQEQIEEARAAGQLGPGEPEVQDAEIIEPSGSN